MKTPPILVRETIYPKKIHNKIETNISRIITTRLFKKFNIVFLAVTTFWGISSTVSHWTSANCSMTREKRVEKALSVLVNQSYIKWSLSRKDDRTCPTVEELYSFSPGQELAVDPWGNNYQIICPSNKTNFGVFSIGEDGIPLTRDDIASWKF